MRHREPEDTPIPLPAPVTIAELARLPRRAHSFELIPTADDLTAAIADLEVLGLRKVRLTGRLDPIGKHDWALRAHLGATVSQPCIVTTKPVTTRLEEPVVRSYLQHWEEPDAASEVEMPEDDTAEALPRSLDLMALLHEALALALPLYPRAEGAAFDTTAVAEPGVAPLRDEDVKPFAGLAGLRDKLADPSDKADADRDIDTGKEPDDT